MVEYNLLKPWLTLDPWQKEYIEAEGDCFVLCGRQSGKTTAASIKAAELVRKNKDYTILMVAFTEKQAYNLFFKTLMYLQARYPKMIKKGKNAPTKHEIRLINGSKIMCYAAGLNAHGLVGFTANKVFIDEAAPMDEEIFVCLAPMLSVTGGSMDLISTPRGKRGFFYKCSLDEHFTKFYINAEDCPRHTKEFLEKQKKRFSPMRYAMEYKALFLDEFKQVFSDKIIKRCCILKRRKERRRMRDYFLGVDIARMGKDLSTFEIIDGTHRDALEQVENLVTKETLTTESTQLILSLNRIYDFNKIMIDDGGMGIGPYDQLLTNDETSRKIMATYSTYRPMDREELKKKKVIKEEMYDTMVSMMNQDKLKLLDDDELTLSLKSVMWEDVNGKIKYSGSCDHIADGLVRAVWAAKKKGLNIWVA